MSLVDSGTFKTSSYLQESEVFEGVRSNVLLSGSDKSALADKRKTRSSLNPSKELEKLGICFGGFSPTVMEADIPKLRELQDAVSQRLADRKSAKDRASELEASRASDVREHASKRTTWRYVLLDDSAVRIESCETSERDLAIPSEIEGRPVVAISANACSAMESVESVSMPDTVVTVGFCAFRDCANLRELLFSGELADFDPGWVRGCHSLEAVRLPGKLDKITQAVFDIEKLKSLYIGEAAYEVMPGAFAKSELERIEVDPNNQFMETDGNALYAKGGSVLLALAVPKESYSVARECYAIARKAFSSFGQLQDVLLPGSLRIIGDFAFTRTSIVRFAAPSALRSIGERAFFACRELRSIELNEGLLFIGRNAFSDTSIAKLEIPSTVEDIAHPIASGTSLVCSGEDATLSIREGDGQKLMLDEFGCLYRREADGLHLVRMLEPCVVEYEVLDGTVAVDEGAFAKHPSIEKVIFPSTLRVIGKGAFKDARKLTTADLPESIEALEDEAFLDTNLQSMDIPASLLRIGSLALVTYGAHHGGAEPSLRRITVSAGNDRFYMTCGLLVEHMQSSDKVVLCTGAACEVTVPNTVTYIAPYAFSSVRTLETLVISDNVSAVEIRGLAFDSMVDLIRVNLSKPIEGHDHFDFRFPKTARGAHQLRCGFGSLNYVKLDAIFDNYDNSIVNRSGFDIAVEADRLSAYEQARLIIERLQDPVLLSKTNRNLMENVLQSQLVDICMDSTRHDDKSVISALFDLGYLNQDNVSQVIESINSMQDASMTNFILDEKMRRFGASLVDFEL